jgi:hypothetical protein
MSLSSAPALPESNRERRRREALTYDLSSVTKTPNGSGMDDVTYLGIAASRLRRAETL